MPYAVLPNLTIVKILNFQNLKLILNCIIHYLFYVTAFSATFNLLTTHLRFLATFCTNMSKNAEARAEQQARLIAMPSRESSSDLHHAQPSLDFDDKITNDMDTKQ